MRQLGDERHWENDMSDEKGESSDDEWQFSQLDEMANKDAKGFKKPKLQLEYWEE
ncbi:hypothetical protein EDB84DRAFT_1565116 [Lactarius hengduanensis]|nr:hypothetical protein EDB84DRAFT_1565116 [Lactarius hengduanensis]